MIDGPSFLFSVKKITEKLAYLRYFYYLCQQINEIDVEPLKPQMPMG